METLKYTFRTEIGLWLLFAVFNSTCFVSGFHVADLTHVHSSSTVYWPGSPQYNFTTLHRGKTDGGFWFETNAWQIPEHGGTHIDAPAHFAENSSRLHQIPMEKLIGPGVIINVKSKVATNPDYRVRVTDLKAWEDVHGRIPEGAVVIMNSGWTYKYPDKTQTFGSQSVDDASTFHFPGWHEETADWLVKNRNVHVVGVDTPSTDCGQAKNYPVHSVLAAASVTGVENVANLDSIPEAGTMIFVAAIKLHDGSGGPARIFATHNTNPLSSESCLPNT